MSAPQSLPGHGFALAEQGQMLWAMGMDGYERWETREGEDESNQHRKARGASPVLGLLISGPTQTNSDQARAKNVGGRLAVP
ncbi:hypothetical protein VTL71DRAFT_10546, partial [Oculimacula yallundae]